MNFLEAMTVDIGQNMIKSNFLDSKSKNNYMRFKLVGKLFYEHRVLLNQVNGMMEEHRAADPLPTDVSDAVFGVPF